MIVVSKKFIIIVGLVMFILGGVATSAALQPDAEPKVITQYETRVVEKEVKVEVEVPGGLTPECLAVLDAFDDVMDTDSAINDDAYDLLDEYNNMKTAFGTGDMQTVSEAQELANTAFSNLGTSTVLRADEVSKLDTLVTACDNSVN